LDLRTPRRVLKCAPQPPTGIGGRGGALKTPRLFFVGVDSEQGRSMYRAQR
jgi:hypothetical protein